jgi:carbon-monoxide dehydrogenase medium subunit
MYQTTYHRASSVDEAASLFAKGTEAKFLAGGQTLLPVMKQRLASPSDVIDLGKIKELQGVELSGDVLTIKAGTTHYDVATNDAAKKAIPALAYLASLIGDPAVRYRGTIGGSIANNDPAADYPAGVLGLGATIVTNKRKIAADDFFKGMYETALGKGEIIEQVVFPIPKRAAYMKFKNPASRYAIVGVFVADTGSGVRVAVTGAGPGVFRVAQMEKALASKFAPESVANISVPEKGLNSDLHAKADYRAHLITVMARRAVEAATK